jgi:DivIVA domain-containing protein
MSLTPDDIRTKRFALARKGYRRVEVDRFLARAAVDLGRLQDGGPDPAHQSRLTPDDVDQVRFHKALRGYSMPQVDDFLDDLAAELARVRGLVAPARPDLSRARADPVPVARALPELPPPPPPPLSAAEVATATFQRGMRGYAIAEVNALLERAARDLDRLERGEPPEAGGEPPLTGDEIRRSRFTLGPRGYEMHDVDVFLARLAERFPAGQERAPGLG